MLSITTIYKRDSKWFIKGNSEAFGSRGEALRRLATMKVKQVNQTYTEGRKFYSEKLDMFFRSNWEIELCEILQELGIKFEYEPRRYYFRRERESYLPDIFLPEYNVWIEIKGYMDSRSEKRVKLFTKYHGHETGFFLYEKEERELVLKDPAVLFTLIQIAIEERERRAK
jgi:hypothetical protein